MKYIPLLILKACCAFGLVIAPVMAQSQSITLANGFAHNDYRHKRPLLDAENNGYTHVEVDVFLHRNKLVVAHINPFFKGKRTLENLYLIPLFEKISNNNGRFYEGYDKPITLMIDIKSNGKKTYAKLKPLLEKYRSILTSYDSSTVSNRAVTIVLSGNKPYNILRKEESRLAFIDKDLNKKSTDTTVSNIYTMASCKYSKLLKWKGSGSISEKEKQRLLNYVSVAHQNGEQVRLWGSPDNKAVWKEMLNCGVDLINTDKLVPLRNFLLANMN
jgi:hypothetical protein